MAGHQLRICLIARPDPVPAQDLTPYLPPYLPVTPYLPEVFADKSQPGMGAEIVGQLFDNKFGHVSIHLLGDQYMLYKSLISIEKSTYFNYEVTDSGYLSIDAKCGKRFFSIIPQKPRKTKIPPKIPTSTMENNESSLINREFLYSSESCFSD